MDAESRGRLAEHGIFVCGVEHRHETVAVPTQDESGPLLAQPPLHPELLPTAESALEGDLSEEPDVWLAAGRLYADMQTDPTGGSQIPILRYAYVLGLLMGHTSRVEAENRLLRATLERHLIH
jgi:hypothetical protein